MSDDTFQVLEQALESGGPAAGLDLLIEQFRTEKKYPLLFEARVLKSRHALDLPLVQVDRAEELPPEKRRAHEQAFMEAAREVGGLFLADGDIPRAWPYFRAIGESAPVAAAIETIEPAEGQDAIIEIALHERVNPKKGFELILADYGTCRAITFFEQYPDRATKEDCARILVRKLHRDLVASLKRTIAQQEGSAPETDSIPALIEGRDWLFGEYDYYVDTSHLVSIVRFAIDLSDRESLALALELTEYGKRLSHNFQFRGDPPFEDGHTDYAFYLRALMGEGVEDAIAHFRDKIAKADPERDGAIAAQVLVDLLARLKRYSEAIDISLEHLQNTDPAQMFCPSVFQLCQMAGDYERLRQLAREKGDLLHFAAGAVQADNFVRTSGARNP
jgi:hypothetical protein